jgi:hypothetical protein
MITTLIAACLLGLAMAGGTWKVSYAGTIPTTIPSIFDMNPKWIHTWSTWDCVQNGTKKDAACLNITGHEFITGYDGGPYTFVRLINMKEPNVVVDVKASYLTGTVLDTAVLGTSVMAQPGEWEVWVINHHGDLNDVTISPSPMHLTISDGKFYLPLITNNK